MEKGVDDGMHPPVRQLSHTSSIRESTEEHDVEQTAGKAEEEVGDLELSRTVSGPPYSIYSPSTKLFIVGFVSVSSLISPFGATTFYPALNVLAKQLNVTPTLVNLGLTTYMVSTSHDTGRTRN